MKITVKMINAAGVKSAGPPYQTMNFITFAQEKFSKIRAILTGNARKKSFFHFTS
jgi:hypothetical protein